MCEEGGYPQGTSSVPLLVPSDGVTSREAFFIDGITDIDEARLCVKHWLWEYKRLTQMFDRKQQVITALSDSLDSCNRIMLQLRVLCPDIAEDLLNRYGIVESLARGRGEFSN